MELFNAILASIGTVLWHPYVLYALLSTGVVLTIVSGFCQYRALTHGTKVLRGAYDDPNDPGAINHFQALSAALSATVGLGNIGGVAIAIALGGPGAVFWMWVVGFFGMAIKFTEVTLSMLYRNTDDPDNPHGGPMWVVDKGLRRINPKLGGLARFLGVLFCITLLVSTVTGGNMFQAWNVAGLTEQYFGVPGVATGIFMAIIVGDGHHRRHQANRRRRGSTGADHGRPVPGRRHLRTDRQCRPDSRHLRTDLPRGSFADRGGRRIHRWHRGVCLCSGHETRFVLQRSRPGFFADRPLRGQDRRTGTRRPRCRSRAFYRYIGRVHVQRTDYPGDRCLEPRRRSAVRHTPGRDPGRSRRVDHRGKTDAETHAAIRGLQARISSCSLQADANKNAGNNLHRIDGIVIEEADGTLTPQWGRLTSATRPQSA